jgi:hypothetical protein
VREHTLLIHHKIGTIHNVPEQCDRNVVVQSVTISLLPVGLEIVAVLQSESRLFVEQ